MHGITTIESELYFVSKDLTSQIPPVSSRALLPSGARVGCFHEVRDEIDIFCS